MTKKKILNIPICDVQIDNDYDNYIAPTFTAWPSYVKHVRKIGEETDITSDFLLEDSDLAWLADYNSKHAHDQLNTTTFEAALNLFERVNGSSSTNLNQAQAVKHLMDKLFTPSGTLHLLYLVYLNLFSIYCRLLSFQIFIIIFNNFELLDGVKISRLGVELYKYWISRRDKLGKALCRRYWPLVTASDTNPYQVFRVRDRERYRLRRQQK